MQFQSSTLNTIKSNVTDRQAKLGLRPRPSAVCTSFYLVLTRPLGFGISSAAERAGETPRLSWPGTGEDDLDLLLEGREDEDPLIRGIGRL